MSGSVSGAPNLTVITALTQFVGGTQAAWNNVTTPVPAGLIVYATDTTNIKIGDGQNLYANLPVILTVNTLNTFLSDANATSITQGTTISSINTNLGSIQAEITALQTGKADLSGATFTGPTTFAASPILDNEVVIQGRDTSGTLRGLIGPLSSNYTGVFAGESGLVIQNTSASTNLVIIDTSGNVTTAGSISTPSLTSSGFSYSETPTTGDNSTKVATTSFVQSLVNSVNVGTLSAEIATINITLGTIEAEISTIDNSLGTIEAEISALQTGKANLSGATFTGQVNFTVAPVLNDQVVIQGLDSGGTAHGLIGYLSTGYVATYAGTTGWVVQNTSASANLLLLDTSGNLTAGGSLTGGTDSNGWNFKAYAAGYTSGFQNNGNSTYLLVTNLNGTAINGLRPFYFNNATGVVGVDGTGAGTNFGGAVTIAGGATIDGVATVGSSLTISSYGYVATPPTGDNSTKMATTNYVQAELALLPSPQAANQFQQFAAGASGTVTATIYAPCAGYVLLTGIRNVSQPTGSASESQLYLDGGTLYSDTTQGSNAHTFTSLVAAGSHTVSYAATCVQAFSLGCSIFFVPETASL